MSSQPFRILNTTELTLQLLCVGTKWRDGATRHCSIAPESKLLVIMSDAERYILYVDQQIGTGKHKQPLMIAQQMAVVTKQYSTISWTISAEILSPSCYKISCEKHGNTIVVQANKIKQ